MTEVTHHHIKSHYFSLLLNKIISLNYQKTNPSPMKTVLPKFIDISLNKKLLHLIQIQEFSFYSLLSNSDIQMAFSSSIKLLLFETTALRFPVFS